MESDDDEMRDASSFSGGGGEEEGGESEEAGEGVVVMEVRWFEVDLDYQFDAPRWFDLAQEEPPVEAAAAEQWFAGAPSYPPSPLIAMMMSEDLGLQNLRSIADIDPKHCSKSSQDYSGGAERTMHRSLAPNEGRMPCYGVSENKQKTRTQTMVKGTFSKGSTLMKPTASQLARQNRQLEARNAMLSKKSVGVRTERCTMMPNDCTHQASKRQKLESGHLNMVTATNQPDLIHKIHEKNVVISSSDRATGPPKLKITIPREPELATKLRAERSRILRALPAKKLNDQEAQSASTKNVALPRQVVQPFQPSNHHYANVHANGASNMRVRTSNHTSHLHKIDKKPEACRDGLFKFKAQPLDKKILASKGDIGVLQNAKKNATVPKEFNLSANRKGKQAPLSELFNKLSLTAARCAIDRQASEHLNYITTKDCKENMIGGVWC